MYRFVPLVAMLLAVAGCDLLEPDTPSVTDSITGEASPTTLASSRRASNSDRAALVALYNAMSGPSWAYTNWLTDAPLGEWYGVKVDDEGRVQELQLSAFHGSIPPEIGDLAKLRSLWIWGFGRLSSLIPPEIGKLANLESLRLDGGSPAGPIPPEIGDLTNLQHLRLEGDLDGPIPPEIGNLVNLTSLHLWGISGPIPSEIGNLASLTELELRGGGLMIPSEIGNLTSLTSLHLTGLPGPIPPEIGNLASLTKLWLSGHLRDPLPPEIGMLTSLESLAINGLSHVLPPEIGRLASLRYLSVEGSEIGPMPPEIGQLSSLMSLHLRGLGNNSGLDLIPPEIGELTELVSLTISGFELSGSIPPGIGRLANLKQLRLSGGSLSGPIPAEIGNLTNLIDLELLGGFDVIPPEIGRLAYLERLTIGGFSGSIPPEIGSLASLTWLYLAGHRSSSSGPIPQEIGNLSELSGFWLSGGFTGPIPSGIGNLVKLSSVWLSGDLSGPLPPEIGNLSRLEELRLGSNDLSGPVPATIGRLSRLRHLDLTDNSKMSGPLPADMTGLRRLNALLAEGTRLCAPTDASFRRWLTRVGQSRVRACLDGNLSAAYLVQAVQSREFPVPLVAGERALLRVFPIAKQVTTAGIPDVRARFFHDGRETHVVSIPGTAVPIPTQVDEGSLAKSANVEIPGYVVQPGLEMVVEIDPSGTLDSALLATKRIPETGRLDVAVRTMPLFDLTLVPFVWTQTHDSSRVELVKAIEADPENHETLQRARTLLPIGDIKVTAHEAVLSSSTSAHDLYHEVSAIQALEGGRGYFMGILPPQYSGNAAGMANRPGKLSVSSASGSTIAHELGHNLSLGHVRCGNRNPGFVDQRYPHPDGSIGAWGYDFRDGGAVVPTSHMDLMSYCGPQWISDYHFTNAFSYRARNPRNAAPASTTPTRSILLWGGVGTDGEPYMEPAFVVDAPPLLPRRGGEYRIAGHAKGGGGELFSLSFDMPELAHGDGNSSFAFVLPVNAEWQDHLASITLTGPGGAYVLDEESDLPMAILRNPQTGRVQGLLRGESAPVMQVARDVTVSPSRAEVEMLFSRGIPDPAAWNR